MYKSINQWSFPAGMTIAQMMRQAKELAFDAFEPALSWTGELSLESTDDEVRAIRAEAERIGIRLSSLAGNQAWSCSPIANDPAERERAFANTVRQLECAQLLGVEAILFVPGVVGRGEDPVDWQDAWTRSVDVLRRLVPVAQKCGVVIGVENVWNDFLLSPKDMTDLIDAVDSEWVRAYFDAGNVLKYGYPEMWVRMLCKRIVRVHIKDYKRAVGTLDGFCDLLCGDVDFPAVMRELRNAGYDADIITELGASGCYPQDNVRRISAAMDVILGRA